MSLTRKLANAAKLRMKKQCVRCLGVSHVFTARGEGISKSRCDQCKEDTLHRYTCAPENLKPLKFPVLKS